MSPPSPVWMVILLTVPVGIGIAVAGFGITWLIVGFATAIQLRTPQRLQGRVASAASTLIGTPQTLSIALGAALVSVVDYRILVAVMAAVVCACGAYLLTRPAETPAPSVATPPAPSADPILSPPQP